MIYKVQVVIIGLLLMGWLTGCRGNKPVSTAFTRNTSLRTGKDTAAKSVRVFMNADTTQKKSAKGLSFSIKLQNDAPTGVNIRNPLDLLGLAIVNASWKELQIPYKGRRLGHDGGWTNNSFVVNRFTINGKSTDVKLLKDYYINIPENSKVEIFIGVPNLLKPDAVRPYTVEQTIPVPTGKYNVLLTLVLMEGKSADVLNMPPLSINYQ
jgi:hypothetical protein